jgi:hypothetical protein
MSSNQQVRPLQVKPLALGGSGSQTRVGKELDKHNLNLTMQLAQVQADTKYDPTVPNRPTNATFVEQFESGSEPISKVLAVSGILLIVFGLVLK